MPDQPDLFAETPIDASRGPQPAQPLSVSEFTLQIKRALETSFSSVQVVGEVSNLVRAQSGHLYFNLKDDHAQLRAVIWRSTTQRLKIDLVDGQQIVCGGDIDLYPPRGAYQLIVRQVELQGEGEWQRALRQLFEKLRAEGLFDRESKQPLPRFPGCIAIVTSPSGAAVRDFCQIVLRRWPRLHLLIAPCRVQGDQAPAEIVAAIERVQRLRPRPDVVVVTRGGGSIEDLWAFNDERVVRAIHACDIPTIAAIGHEIDHTLAEFAADRRAATPSEAGEIAVPEWGEVIAALRETQHRLERLLRYRTETARNRLDAIASRRIFQRPLDFVRELHQQVDQANERLVSAIRRSVRDQRRALESAVGQLDAINPLAVLARGYSLTSDSQGRLVRYPDQVQVGDPITTLSNWGTIDSRVVVVTDNPQLQPTPRELDE